MSLDGAARQHDVTYAAMRATENGCSAVDGGQPTFPLFVRFHLNSFLRITTLSSLWFLTFSVSNLVFETLLRLRNRFQR